MNAQNKMKREGDIQGEVRCLLVSTGNLLRLFSLQAESDTMEKGASKQDGPAAKAMAFGER
jgi:hypothetical protein